MENLELKHVAPYLPYELELISNKGLRTTMKSIDILINMVNFGHGNALELNEFKPILRPLSDLVKECELEYNPEEIGTSWVEQLLGKNLRYFNYLTYHPVFNNYWQFEKLVENHFDVFGLIEKGLAISYNDVNNS